MNPRQLVQDTLDRMGLAKTLGIRIDAVEPGHVALALDLSNAVSQFDGYFHGGAMASLADCAAGAAAATADPMADRVVTTHLDVTYFRPAKGDMLLARALCRHAGRALRVVVVEIFVKHGDEEGPVAVGTASLTVTPVSDAS